MQKKAFDKIKHLFILETLKRVGIEKMCNNIIKATSDNPTVQFSSVQWLTHVQLFVTP